MGKHLRYQLSKTFHKINQYCIDYKLSEQLVDYFSKISQHEYEFAMITQNRIAGGVIYVTFVILEKLVNKKLLTKALMKRLTKFMSANEKSILDIAKKILVVTQNFDTRHPGLNNMKDVQFKQLCPYIKM